MSNARFIGSRFPDATGLTVEIVLQNNGRCCGVEERLALAPVFFRAGQELLGLVARQSFVL
jgi:hypothetical protein